MYSAGDESCKVRHVDQKERAHFVGNLAHAGEVNGAGIGAASAYNQSRMFPFGEPLQLVIIDGLGFLGDAVGNDLVSLARKIQMMAMRKMTAMRQVQSKDRVAGLQHG